jgi:tetratricopeptide (TPR) repeat protein
MAKGNWAAAVPLLEAHIAGHFDDDEAVAELGYVYARLGDKEMALQTLQSALWMNPRSLRGQPGSGRVLCRAKKTASMPWKGWRLWTVSAFSGAANTAD